MIYFEVQFPKENSPKGMKRRAQQADREAQKKTVYYWWDRIAERHFAPNARNYYGYAKRGSRYDFKKRSKGINRPLVWTGALKTAFLTRRPPATRYKGQTRLKFSNLPKHAYYLNNELNTKKGGRRIVRQPNKPAELTTVNQRDAEELAKQYERYYSKLMVKGS